MLAFALAIISLAIWTYLLLARGGFWLGRERDDFVVRALAEWPTVAAVVPARNEAEVVGESVGSLLRQDYAGSFRVFLVDDNSDDGTAEIAAGHATPDGPPLSVVTGAPLPAGWTGKLWAVSQGIAAADNGARAPKYLLLTDADIVHTPDSLTRLVAHAETNSLAMVSLMAKLRCDSFAERALVPAFIFFFQMLYPFAWVNRPHGLGAAAGGCMLVRADAMRQIGGIGAIRNALIDDCTLGARLKEQGPVWLGLTDRVRSIRPYPDFADIRRMVSRSAYTQLQYSPVLLAGTVLGMLLTYLAPVALAVFAEGAARWIGLAVWIAMAVSFMPTLRFYRLSLLWGFALPGIAFLYMLYTLDSAYQYARGRGGAWKGRAQANLSSASSAGASSSETS